MIVIKNKNELKGAERFGECLSCGGKKDIVKIELTQVGKYDKVSVTHSIRLCKRCANVLRSMLGEVI